MSKLKIVVITILISLFLSACTSQNGGDQTDGASDGSSQVYDIVWWGLFDKEEVIQPLIDAYRVANPNVNISYVQITEGLESGNLIESYIARLDENITDQEPLDTPDIITINNTWLGKYSQYLSPAPSTTFSATTIQDEYFPVVTEDFVRGSSVYAVPLYMDSIAMIVNQSLLEKLSPADSAGPENNWFDFKDQAERATRINSEDKVNIAGFSAGSNNVEFAPDVVSLLMLQSNINMVTTNDISGFAESAVFAADDETQAILEFYSSFADSQEEKTWNDTYISEVAKFLEQKLVMYAAPSWRLNDILRLNQKYNLNLDVEVYPVPQINPNDVNDYKYWANYWGIGVTFDSQSRGQSSVAWDFIRFISENDQLQTLNNNSLSQEDRVLEYIYPKRLLANDQKSNEDLSVYIESLERATTWDMIDGFEVGKIFRDEFSTATQDDQALQSSVNQIIENRINLLTATSTP